MYCRPKKAPQKAVTLVTARTGSRPYSVTLGRYPPTNHAYRHDQGFLETETLSSLTTQQACYQTVIELLFICDMLAVKYG